MFASRYSLTTLLFSAAILLGGPALAADEPVASANPRTPRVAAQIDEYLKTSPAIELPKERAVGITPGADAPRQVHGLVEIAVGSHGYRTAYVRSDFPVGKTGTLSIAVQDSQFRGRGGYGYSGYGDYGDYRGYGGGQNIGIGLAFGGAARADADQRCGSVGGDGRRRHRIDPMYSGPDVGPMDGGRSYACEQRQPPLEDR